MTNKIDLLVFDLDGTLVDSRRDLINAVNWTLDSLEVEPLPEDLIARHVGTGVMPMIQAFLRTKGVADFDLASRTFSDWYLGHLAEHTRLYPGMDDVLKRFRGVKKVILTNKSNVFVGPLLKALNLEEHFAKAYGRDSFPTRKPDPGPLIAILKEFSVAPENAVMIGDTDVDLITAKGAGVPACAVSYGFGQAAELRACSPDYWVDEARELIALFEAKVNL